ncbi:MAG: MMPL family transporter, partial [Planctomycetaceae bacterium]|nr:MMPL family transporter [Planctomycetaceae bacterium]
GIAVDDTLHLMTWFRQNRSQGLAPPEAVTQALVHCGPAMVQTSLIISIGLLMLFPTELLLIRRFGWLMALLVISALIADLVLLPALLVGPLSHLKQAEPSSES